MIVIFNSITGGVQCWVNGISYAPGATGIPKGDGCNTCTCEASGNPWCTDVVCNGTFTLTTDLMFN